MTEKLRGVFLRWTEARQTAAERSRAADAEGAGEDVRRAADEAVRAAEAVERELRAAIETEPVGVAADAPAGGGAEARERAALRERARVGAFVAAAYHGRPVGGAEAELAAAAGTGGLLPIELVCRSRPAAGEEHRVATPAPATTAIQQHAIVPALFDRSVAPYLGVEMPMVPTGTPAYPYLSTSVTAAPRAAGAAAPETAGAFSVATADPRRVTGAVRLRVEDLARLEGMEESLRANLQDVLSDQLDAQILNGDGNAPNLSGVFSQTTDATAASAVETFSSYMSDMAAVVDGLHAPGAADVRALVSVEVYRHAIALWNTDETMTIGEHLARVYGGFRATRRIAAVSDVSTCLARRGMEMGLVKAPVWSGMELIRDPYTGAGSGEVVITAHTLIGGVCFSRDANSLFRELSFQTA